MTSRLLVFTALLFTLLGCQKEPEGSKAADAAAAAQTEAAQDKADASAAATEKPSAADASFASAAPEAADAATGAAQVEPDAQGAEEEAAPTPAPQAQMAAVPARAEVVVAQPGFVSYRDFGGLINQVKTALPAPVAAELEGELGPFTMLGQLPKEGANADQNILISLPTVESIPGKEGAAPEFVTTLYASLPATDAKAHADALSAWLVGSKRFTSPDPKPVDCGAQPCRVLTYASAPAMLVLVERDTDVAAVLVHTSAETLAPERVIAGLSPFTVAPSEPPRLTPALAALLASDVQAGAHLRYRDMATLGAQMGLIDVVGALNDVAPDMQLAITASGIALTLNVHSMAHPWLELEDTALIWRSGSALEMVHTLTKHGEAIQDALASAQKAPFPKLDAAPTASLRWQGALGKGLEAAGDEDLDLGLDASSATAAIHMGGIWGYMLVPSTSYVALSQLAPSIKDLGIDLSGVVGVEVQLLGQTPVAFVQFDSEASLKGFVDGPIKGNALAHQVVQGASVPTVLVGMSPNLPAVAEAAPTGSSANGFELNAQLAEVAKLAIPDPRAVPPVKLRWTRQRAGHALVDQMVFGESAAPALPAVQVASFMPVDDASKDSAMRCAYDATRIIVGHFQSLEKGPKPFDPKPLEALVTCASKDPRAAARVALETRAMALFEELKTAKPASP